MNTKQEITSFIQRRGQVNIEDLVNKFGISRQIIHRHLSDLVKSGQLEKLGRSPRVFYKSAEEKMVGTMIVFDKNIKKVIDENFMLITPSGEKKEGVPAFIEWCVKRNEDPLKTAKDYIASYKKYDNYKKDGLVDGKYKIKHTFDKVYLDKVFYLDFYSIERFGKTKLGQILLYAKQSQSKELIRELITEIRPKIGFLIKKMSIDAVGFIPPTVKREVQLMREIEKQLNLPVPIISLVKVKKEISVPQKTLTKLEDRIENARSTIVLDESRKLKTILLIDDALGSGSTLNETAKKIKDQGVAQIVIGLAITGSFGGFEVISEV